MMRPSGSPQASQLTAISYLTLIEASLPRLKHWLDVSASLHRRTIGDLMRPSGSPQASQLTAISYLTL
eukprot:scaffold8664_cov143-Skeletonema_marinoi.AAC.15